MKKDLSKLTREIESEYENQGMVQLVIPFGYLKIEEYSEGGFDYTFYNEQFDNVDGGIIDCSEEDFHELYFIDLVKEILNIFEINLELCRVDDSKDYAFEEYKRFKEVTNKE